MAASLRQVGLPVALVVATAMLVGEASIAANDTYDVRGKVTSAALISAHAAATATTPPAKARTDASRTSSSPRPGSRSSTSSSGFFLAAKPAGSRWTRLRQRLAGERGGKAGDDGPNLIYEHNPKHGPVTRQGPRGEISRAPRGDCQSMLECSTLVKPGLRRGIEPETGLEVIFRRHRVFENTGWWHGYVPGG
jgi:hypothetical protein